MVIHLYATCCVYTHTYTYMYMHSMFMYSTYTGTTVHSRDTGYVLIVYSIHVYTTVTVIFASWAVGIRG